MGADGTKGLITTPCNLTEDEWEEVRHIADVKFDIDRVSSVTVTFDDSGDTCEATLRW